MEEKKITGWQDAFKLIESDSSTLAQSKVREALHEKRGFKREKINKVLLGKMLRKNLKIDVDDNRVVSLFKSHIISHAIPSFTKIIGLVQHDQYHRFSGLQL